VEMQPTPVPLAWAAFPPGLRTFLIIWAGQLVSLLGTGMTRFALLIWAYQQTGAATTVALLGFFSFIPFILISPLAGIVVDRVDRRLVMIFSDLAAGITTIGLLLLYSSGDLAIWHLYAAGLLMGIFEAFQGPAYSASTTLLVAPKEYSRVNGLRTLAESASQVLAPLMAGVLLVWIGLAGVMWVDVATFLVAMVTLLIVRIPRPSADGSEHAPSHWRADMSYGLRFIFQRPGLVGLIAIFVGLNLFGTITYFAILPALILARGAGELGWATVQMGLGLGGVVGSLFASTWGGPRRRIHAIYGGAALSFMCDWFFAFGQTVPVWTTGAFLASLFIPLIMGNNQSIWQSKVPPAAQGRVFAASGMLRMASMPVAYLLAGPLADRVFEPGMRAGGVLAPIFGPLVGTGPGTGMALMFFFTGILGTSMALCGYLWPPARRVELDLPDTVSLQSPQEVTP
jgi:MFS transporter, DHA3 family, macrolide efflux protein